MHGGGNLAVGLNRIDDVEGSESGHLVGADLTRQYPKLLESLLEGNEAMLFQLVHGAFDAAARIEAILLKGNVDSHGSFCGLPAVSMDRSTGPVKQILCLEPLGRSRN